MSKQGVDYTLKQAERLKRKIDREVAKIEDALSVLRHTVPDTTASNFAPGAGGIDGIAEEVRANRPRPERHHRPPNGDRP